MPPVLVVAQVERAPELAAAELNRHGAYVRTQRAGCAIACSANHRTAWAGFGCARSSALRYAAAAAWPRMPSAMSSDCAVE